MKNSKRKLLTVLFTAAAVTGLASIAASADTYTDSNGDEFTYTIDPEGVMITAVKESGDGKVVIPGKIEETAVYSFVSQKAGITSLDASKCTSLTQLYCRNDKLTSLDISKNTKLKTLYCDENQLQSLDVSNNTDLEELICYKNQLTVLELSKNTKLDNLNCWGNQLESLDVSNNTKLWRISCGFNKLDKLDLKANTNRCGCHAATTI